MFHEKIVIASTSVLLIALFGHGGAACQFVAFLLSEDKALFGNYVWSVLLVVKQRRSLDHFSYITDMTSEAVWRP